MFFVKDDIVKMMLLNFFGKYFKKVKKKRFVSKFLIKATNFINIFRYLLIEFLCKKKIQCNDTTKDSIIITNENSACFMMHNIIQIEKHRSGSH